MYRKVLKATLTVVMMMFVLMGGYATFELGFGWPGVALTTLLAIGVLWEIWIQPGRDEAYRQQLLTEIEDLRLEINDTPRNLQDAKDTIQDLKVLLANVTDAYVELKEERVGRDEIN